jgi:hypothetical protein
MDPSFLSRSFSIIVFLSQNLTPIQSLSQFYCQDDLHRLWEKLDHSMLSVAVFVTKERAQNRSDFMQRDQKASLTSHVHISLYSLSTDNWRHRLTIDCWTNVFGVRKRVNVCLETWIALLHCRDNKWLHVQKTTMNSRSQSILLSIKWCVMFMEFVSIVRQKVQLLLREVTLGAKQCWVTRFPSRCQCVPTQETFFSNTISKRNSLSLSLFGLSTWVRRCYIHSLIFSQSASWVDSLSHSSTWYACKHEKKSLDVSSYHFSCVVVILFFWIEKFFSCLLLLVLVKKGIHTHPSWLCERQKRFIQSHSPLIVVNDVLLSRRGYTDNLTKERGYPCTCLTCTSQTPSFSFFWSVSVVLFFNTRLLARVGHNELLSRFPLDSLSLSWHEWKRWWRRRRKISLSNTLSLLYVLHDMPSLCCVSLRWCSMSCFIFSSGRGNTNWQRKKHWTQFDSLLPFPLSFACCCYMLPELQFFLIPLLCQRRENDAQGTIHSNEYSVVINDNLTRVDCMVSLSFPRWQS